MAKSRYLAPKGEQNRPIHSIGSSLWKSRNVGPACRIYYYLGNKSWIPAAADSILSFSLLYNDGYL